MSARLPPWTKRLIGINLIVFLFMVYRGGSWLMPSSEILLSFGAKDLAQIAKGEYWRYFTPIFVHVGIIHFALNMLALRELGSQLEEVVHSFWFLFIYLFAGIFGNISSCIFSLAPSAGASGAIFGLLGAGYVLESRVAKKLEFSTGKKVKRVYGLMVLLNLILGFSIPGIDNAAHLGGLFAGIILSLAMLRIRKNRLQIRKPGLGVLLIFTLTLISIVGLGLSSDPHWVSQRYLQAARVEKDPDLKKFLLGKALDVDPNNAEALDLFFNHLNN